MIAAAQVIYFVSTAGPDPARLLDSLQQALQRLLVDTTQHRVVVLLEQPELGREYRVRVTPCLVLQIGERRVQLPGEIVKLDAKRLERALALA